MYSNSLFVHVRLSIRFLIFAFMDVGLLVYMLIYYTISTNIKLDIIKWLKLQSRTKKVCKKTIDIICGGFISLLLCFI